VRLEVLPGSIEPVLLQHISLLSHASKERFVRLVWHLPHILNLRLLATNRLYRKNERRTMLEFEAPSESLEVA
jgi:hypothetical protein